MVEIPRFHPRARGKGRGASRSVALVLVGIFALGSLATAETVPLTTSWQLAPGVAADWSLPSSWSHGVPTFAHETSVDGGGVALITTGEAVSSLLTVGMQIASRIEQTGGELVVGDLLKLQQGRYEIFGGLLETDGIDLSGPLVFSTVIVPGDTIGFPGGTDLPIAERRLLQAGGRIQVHERVNVFGGNLELLGGVFEADTLLLEAPRGLISVFSENAIAQKTGASSAIGSLMVQDGRYFLEGGTLDSGSVSLGDPNGALGSFGIGRSFASNRLPEFVQTGGIHRVLGLLGMCGPRVIFEELQPFREVVYELHGGDLEVGGDLIVGSLAVAPVRFSQSGGSNRVAGTLRIEGDSSRYEFLGGDLTVGALAVGTDVFNLGGTLVLGESSVLSTQGKVVFGEDSQIEVAAGGALRLDGADFENLSQQPEDLADFHQLHLRVEGGDDVVSRLEVAGRDLGNTHEGMVQNFAYGTIEVGAEGPSHLRLVDESVNHPASGEGQDESEVEALYVENLIVHAGSTLETGPINVYYKNAQMDGLLLSPGKVRSLPEPGAFSLGLVALAGLSALRSVAGRVRA